MHSHQNFTGARDTIGRARYLLGPAAQYTAFEVPIEYASPGIQADSIVVKFTSSIAGFCANASNGTCLYLTVDDIEVSTVTGLHEILAPEPSFSLYPSPSSSGFSISTPAAATYPLDLKLFELNGRQVYRLTIPFKSEAIIDPALPQGIYLWKMTDASGENRAGKWHRF